MTEEPRYTLAEARVKLSELECKYQGHDYNVITVGIDPVRVTCDRCGLHRIIPSCDDHPRSSLVKKFNGGNVCWICDECSTITGYDETEENS